MLCSNYRPVSVLPTFSKILERLIYNRLLKFVTKYNILYSYQFGFRINHSPSLALLLLVDKISNALEEGEFVLGLFLDFSKAFDTVNHHILFAKLEFYGIRGTALELFKSYLSNRVQYVEYNNVQSSKQSIKCGVPQGSILGPLLFLLYINDLSSVSSKLFSLLFADDSNMFITGKDPNELIKTMNTEIGFVIDWLKVNKLSLNLKKTHFIIFRRQRAKINVFEELKIENVKIEMKDCTKFLGVMIDYCLSFKEHVKLIRGKVARGLGVMYKCRRLINQNALLTLYNSFIYPYFNYCISVWGNTFESYLRPLIILQKRAVRLINGAKKFSNTDPLFKKCKILKLHQIYLYTVQLFMYKFNNRMLPEVFIDFFVKNRNVHSVNTRIQCLYRPPLIHTDPCARSIRVSGVRIFNYFYARVELDPDIAPYKALLREYIVVNDVNMLDV